jgi:FixJ family two-component response regulator
MEPPGQTAKPVDGAGEKLALVVDDRKDVAATIAAMCRATGFRAVAASDGEPIRALLERFRPDCLIVDIMMPDEDGYEALKEVAAFDSRIAVLLVTGHGDTWLRMGVTLGRAQGLQLVQAAAKPVRSDDIRTFLAAASAHRAGG